MITLNSNASSFTTTVVLMTGTAAGTSEEFYHDGDGVASLSQTGLGAGESITLQKKVGSTWRDATDSTGTTVALSSTKPDVSILAAGRYRLNRSISGASATVTLN